MITSTTTLVSKHEQLLK